MGAYLEEGMQMKQNWCLHAHKYKGLKTGFYVIDQSLNLRGKKGL